MTRSELVSGVPQTPEQSSSFASNAGLCQRCVERRVAVLLAEAMFEKYWGRVGIGREKGLVDFLASSQAMGMIRE